MQLIVDKLARQHPLGSSFKLNDTTTMYFAPDGITWSYSPYGILPAMRERVVACSSTNELIWSPTVEVVPIGEAPDQNAEWVRTCTSEYIVRSYYVLTLEKDGLNPIEFPGCSFQSMYGAEAFAAYNTFSKPAGKCDHPSEGFDYKFLEDLRHVNPGLVATQLEGQEDAMRKYLESFVNPFCTTNGKGMDIKGTTVTCGKDVIKTNYSQTVREAVKNSILNNLITRDEQVMRDFCGRMRLNRKISLIQVT